MPIIFIKSTFTPLTTWRRQYKERTRRQAPRNEHSRPRETNYFENCTTREEAKRRYRELAKKHHPDLNGNEHTETMKTINKQYERWR